MRGHRRTKWTDQEAALWQTCVYADALAAGYVPCAPAPVLTQFSLPPAIEARLLGQGSYYELKIEPYVRAVPSSAPLFDRRGLKLTANQVAAFERDERARTSRQAPRMRWKQVDAGQITVGTHGFHLYTGPLLSYYQWSTFRSVNLRAPGLIDVMGWVEGNHVAFSLASVWAELVFVLWARERHPRHPQFLGNSWVPPEFIEKLRKLEQPLPREFCVAAPTTPAPVGAPAPAARLLTSTRPADRLTDYLKR